MSITQLSQNHINHFRSTIWRYYNQYGRSFPWRKTHNPYHILVSEIMLQQTQTYRVIEKYQQFITCLPTFEHLAQAPLQNVLELWQGLGYNRRARYLQQIAHTIVNKYNGVLPKKPAILIQLPGLGHATASSICAFTHHIPVIFIETNIRAVFIHHFFSKKETVHDKKIMPLIEITLEKNRIREWYYALMDYGVMLKKKYPNLNKKSVHYKVQSKFEGSNRQIRGNILKLLLTIRSLNIHEIINTLEKEPDRIKTALLQLENEGFIKKENDLYVINA